MYVEDINKPESKVAQSQKFQGSARSILNVSDGKKFCYHGTAVVWVRNDGCVVLNSGGYRTATTKRAMNQASNEFGLGFSVFALGGVWYVRRGEQIDVFIDKMVLSKIGVPA